MGPRISCRDNSLGKLLLYELYSPSSNQYDPLVLNPFSFDGYEDVAALKRRYLQIRVERAAKKKSSKCDKDRKEELLEERARRINEMECLEKQRSTLELALQERKMQEIATTALIHTCAAIQQDYSAMEKQLDRHLEADAPISLTDSRGATWSASSVVKCVLAKSITSRLPSRILQGQWQRLIKIVLLPCPLANPWSSIRLCKFWNPSK